MNAVTLAHISDLHLPFEPRLTLAQHCSKRQLSVWSWRRRRHIHSSEVLRQLVAELKAAHVDQIVITGDVVNFSLPEEFTAAAHWLRSLAPPDEISLVPGNHDALVPVAHARGLGCWSPWMRVGEGGWPFIHNVGDLVLVGVNTALPTAPTLARGRVGKQQLSRLRDCLRANAGRCRIVLMHHPPGGGTVNWRKALADGGGLRRVLAEAGAELVLYGHARDACFGAVPGPRAAIPSICVASSSALPNPHDAGARWHRLTVSNTAEGWCVRVDIRRWAVDQGTFTDAGSRVLQLAVNAAV